MHRLTNQAIRVDGDRASSRTYVDAVIMFGDNQSASTRSVFYDDEIVRTAAGWRIARRRFTQVRLTTFANRNGAGVPR